MRTLPDAIWYLALRSAMPAADRSRDG
jgi:hypothetical protein